MIIVIEVDSGGLRSGQSQALVVRIYLNWSLFDVKKERTAEVVVVRTVARVFLLRIVGDDPTMIRE